MLDVGTLRGISMSEYIDDNASITSKSLKSNESEEKENDLKSEKCGRDK